MERYVYIYIVIYPKTEPKDPVLICNLHSAALTPNKARLTVLPWTGNRIVGNKHIQKQRLRLKQDILHLSKKVTQHPRVLDILSARWHIAASLRRRVFIYCHIETTIAFLDVLSVCRVSLLVGEEALEDTGHRIQRESETNKSSSALEKDRKGQ